MLARRAGSIRRPDLLGPWLHGVAARIARKARGQAHRRRRREKAEVEMTHVEPAGEGPDPSSLCDEEAAAVHEEVGRLPERYRRAVVLCHFEGLTHAEAARRLGCAPGTVGSLVSRARDMLRTRLTRRGLSAGAIVLAGSLEPRLATAAVPMALERATIRAALLFATRAGGGRRHRLGGGRGAGRRSDQDHDAEQAGDRGHAGRGTRPSSRRRGGAGRGDVAVR